MDKKSLVRKKYFLIRKRKYFQISEKFFTPLIKLIKKKFKNKKIDISLYYPNSFEVDILKILDVNFFKKFNFLFPIVEENNSMNFYKWKKRDVLNINKYGIPEPLKSKKKIPSVLLIPLLAFDSYKNRLGYGKGFYDRYLSKFIWNNNKTLTIGVAFSFQRYNKLPVSNKDFKLKYIITEKGIF